MSNVITARSAGLRAKVALAVLGSVAGLMGAGAASAAGTDSDVPSMAVKYNVHSLATDAGVNELYRRITFAATRVCPDASPRDLSRKQMVEQYRDQAVARAIAQIDNPRLAALHASHSKNG